MVVLFQINLDNIFFIECFEESSEEILHKGYLCLLKSKRQWVWNIKKYAMNTII